MTTTQVPTGTVVYLKSRGSVNGQGISYTDDEFTKALNGHVLAILRDDNGMSSVADVLSKLALTEFATDRLNQILTEPLTELESWRVGEALAEAYLIDHFHCEFPWPTGRDLKNPSASPAGTDLVGFHTDSDGIRFAFGEVKTSEQEQWPPTVLYGRHGMAEQLSGLRDDASIKDYLVRYLAFRYRGATWQMAYESAAVRYLNEPEDVTLFGVLIRDVEPRDLDLASRVAILAKNCPAKTNIHLRAIYLPRGAIGRFAAVAAAAISGAA